MEYDESKGLRRSRSAAGRPLSRDLRKRLLVLRARAGRLDSREVDDLLGPAVATRGSASVLQLVIDLSLCTFIDPSAVAMICAICNAFADAFAGIAVILPENPHAKSYCLKAGLCLQLKPNIRVLSKASVPQAESITSDVLLPLMRVGSSGDVAIAWRRAAEALTSAVTRFGLSNSIIGPSIQVLKEIAMNIVDHAGCEGFATMQAFGFGGPRPFIVIAISDAGLGIRRNIADKRKDLISNHMSDSDVLRITAQNSVTSRSDVETGTCFEAMRVAMGNVGGSVLVRSGRGRYFEADLTPAPYVDGTHVLGTHVRLRLDCRAA